jgi:Transposase DDE domain group 1
MLRAGSAGSNTVADHVETTRLALAQLPRHLRRRVLVRTDSAGGTHGFLDWLTAPSRRLRYSAGMTIAEDMQAAILKVPAGSWTPAYDGDGQVRDGAWVADITGLSSWPAGMRVVVRKERPHPGAQLRFTDLDGHRFTAFATDAKRGQLADLELRHRRRARCEDRIRNAKDTGLRNFPLKGFAQNQLWCEIVSLACELLAWTQLLALTGTARRWEPKRLRLRVFTVAGAPHPQRPPPAAPPRRTTALDRGHHRRRHPSASDPIRLTSRSRPDDQEGATQGPVEPRPPGATARQPATADTRKSTPPGYLRPAHQPRDRG